MSLSELLVDLGYWLCHQDPHRTLTFGEAPLPLCIRCTALYLFLGIPLWLGPIAGRPRFWWSLPASVAVALLGCAVMLLQWAGAQIDLWSSNTLNRTLTGVAAGLGIGVLIQTAFALRFGRDGGRPIVGLALVVAASAASLWLLLWPPGWEPLALLIGVLSIGGFFTSVGWCTAIVLSFVIRDASHSPRVLPIAAASVLVTVATAIVMALVRF